MRIRTGIIVLLAVSYLSWAPVVFSQVPARPTTSKPHRKRGAIKLRPVRQNGSSAGIYTVKQGDTLGRIARDHGTSIASLKSANQLRTSRLQVGQRLKLPGSPEPVASPVKSPDSYKPGGEGSPAGSVVAASSERGIESPLLDFRTPNEDPNLPTVASDESNANPQPESESQPLRVRLASTGMGFIGVRYRWNGNSEASGFDCSGLVKSLFDKFNISLPRTSREQYKVGEKVDKNKLEVGDLVFFSSRGKTPSHVGIYLGDNQFLHAARKARRVIISSLGGSWYAKRFLGARRLLDLWAEEPASADTKPN